MLISLNNAHQNFLVLSGLMPDCRTLYTALNTLAQIDLSAQVVTNDIAQLAQTALEKLSEYQVVHLQTAIPDKEYFVFQNGNFYSRPINKNLWMSEIPEDVMSKYMNFQWADFHPDTLQKLLYTIGMSYCATADSLGGQDKKTPSVFFEIFIGNLFAREFGVNPATQVQVDIDGQSTSLPTDYLFTPANQFVKLHIPCKLSTRERSVQAWAHQKVLEGIHGVGRYKGVMVCMAETNFVRRNLSVVEVCLPDQWRLYQMYISRMERIYYFDIPKKYEELRTKFPYIQVKPFSQFFLEKDALIQH